MYALSPSSLWSFSLNLRHTMAQPRECRPEDGGIQRPTLVGKGIRQAAGEKDGLHTTKPQTDDRRPDGIGDFARPNKGELATRKHCAAMVLS